MAVLLNPSRSQINSPQTSHPASINNRDIHSEVAPAILPLPVRHVRSVETEALATCDTLSREKKHGCTMCHKRFDRPSTLRKHLLVHTGEKAFVCDTCGRRFGVASNLNRHVKRCILKPVNAAAAGKQSSPGTAGNSSDSQSARDPSPSSSNTLSSNSSDQPSSPAHQSTPSPARQSRASAPAAPKRRRRAPSPSRWIPPSLLSFNLTPPESRQSTPVPLPPVRRNLPKEERNSWDENVASSPYHPRGWKNVLPGPGLGLGLGLSGKDVRNLNLGGNGGFMLGRAAAATEVVNFILGMTIGPKKRHPAEMFLELVDRTGWPQYYEVIPEPRCLNNIKSGIEKGRYRDASDIYTDLSLVFWNAIFYNEAESQIALDAKTLKTALETEWKKRSVLPPARTSPPPSSAQKVHKVEEEEVSVDDDDMPSSAPTPAPAPVALTPAQARIVTPATRSTPVPTSTSTGHVVQTKSVTTRQKSAQLLPDMDVDILSDDGQGSSALPGVIEMDQESEEIVRQLEKGLLRWPGFSEEGWSTDVGQERIADVVHAIKSYKDVIGNRLATALEAMPEETTVQYLSFTSPLSLKSIEARARSHSYQSSREFDLDMARLFEKARRWHRPSTEPYGRVLLLQRLYQDLMSSNPPPGPPYHSATNFAALRAGPGNVKLHASEGDGVVGVTTHRVSTKDRTFVDELHYKGWSVKLGDWVHLSNPDDPTRPIIAQVSKCWVTDEL
ncbi:hypothetical protein DXG03_009085 [Asterophora parasitica]|uniref:Uncharacterized protein n=1 Tax=Asterophora parasitica TaxID=117018 RepID=A0A9P7G5V8_9AGAR|nr:hypothetical protein DXG03_009085 [Asterophora parasitica]